jgi:hypothetical protein
MRLLEESELDAVRKVCGNSLGVGLTVSVPSSKEVKHSLIPMNGTIWMRDNHDDRIISCLPTERDLDLSKGKCCIDVADVDLLEYKRSCKLRCSYRGVDLRHMQSKSKIWELVVHARFAKVKGSSLAVRKAQGIFLNDGAALDVESGDIGDYLRIGVPPHLNTYVLDSINNDVVCCKNVTDENDTPIFMLLQEANLQYNKYISY